MSNILKNLAVLNKCTCENNIVMLEFQINMVPTTFNLIPLFGELHDEVLNYSLNDIKISWHWQPIINNTVSSYYTNVIAIVTGSEKSITRMIKEIL
jgi:hypothetical protein